MANAPATIVLDADEPLPPTDRASQNPLYRYRARHMLSGASLPVLPMSPHFARPRPSIGTYARAALGHPLDANARESPVSSTETTRGRRQGDTAQEMGLERSGSKRSQPSSGFTTSNSRRRNLTPTPEVLDLSSPQGSTPAPQSSPPVLSLDSSPPRHLRFNLDDSPTEPQAATTHRR